MVFLGGEEMNVMQEIERQYRDFHNKECFGSPNTVYLSEDCFYTLLKQREYFMTGQMHRDIENQNKHTVMGMNILIVVNCRKYIHVAEANK